MDSVAQISACFFIFSFVSALSQRVLRCWFKLIVLGQILADGLLSRVCTTAVDSPGSYNYSMDWYSCFYRNNWWLPWKSRRRGYSRNGPNAILKRYTLFSSCKKTWDLALQNSLNILNPFYELGGHRLEIQGIDMFPEVFEHLIPGFIEAGCS